MTGSQDNYTGTVFSNKTDTMAHEPMISDGGVSHHPRRGQHNHIIIIAPTSEGPGATIHFKGDRKNQTALARLTSGHLKTLRFSRGDKKFNICTKCNLIEATPQHLLDCVALVYYDLLKRQDFVLEVMKANNLMDLI
ncbi:hypothetical protein AVEN_167457-1 [Araneus ventricosus]|uniref:Uncharacterized protein n=1 Tax=Araneus ventricosus TaxID=182803 RepID=A0A4Y2EN85_ARAVE|nr:hypothetical protein AVEN_167457-1 [Araneus ventricosus]